MNNALSDFFQSNKLKYYSAPPWKELIFEDVWTKQRRPFLGGAEGSGPKRGVSGARRWPLKGPHIIEQQPAKSRLL